MLRYMYIAKMHKMKQKLKKKTDTESQRQRWSSYVSCGRRSHRQIRQLRTGDRFQKSCMETTKPQPSEDGDHFKNLRDSDSVRLKSTFSSLVGTNTFIWKNFTIHTNDKPVTIHESWANCSAPYTHPPSMA